MARFWFLLGVAGLVVLALPAIVLLAGSLTGWEGTWNAWSEANLGVSYHLPLPAWAGWLLLLAPPVLVLLYFLKLKRRPLAVPSTFLWRKSIEDVHVNSLFQWLRRNILLLLQMLLLLVLFYALLAPRLHARSGTGRHYILMLDNSASMSATDVATGRLDQARTEALREIDAHTDADFGMVVVFNSSAEILQSYTSNRQLLRAAVNSVTPTQRTTHIEEALTLADSLANPSRSTDDASVTPDNVTPGKERTYVTTDGIPTEVHLYSDGRFADVPDFALGNLNLTFHAIGKAGPDADNIGIVNFNVLRDEERPADAQLYARILNYRDKPATVEFDAEVRVPGRPPLELKRTLTLPPRTVTRTPVKKTADGTPDPASGKVEKDTPGEATATFELSELDENVEVEVRGRLRNHRDAFALDDEAWLVVGVVRKARVLIVSAGNPILKAFFDDASTRAVATVTWLTPADLADPTKYGTPAHDGAYDLTIFDRCAPEKEADLPRGNTLFIGAAPPPWKAGEAEKMENAFVKGWSNRHPAMRYLTALQDVGIAEAFRLTDLPPKTPLLMEGDKGLPLLAALSRDAFTDLVLAFPLVTDKGEWNTNWPLQPSFPLFLRNVLYALGNVSDAAGEENTQPGRPRVLRPGGSTSELTVTGPDGVPPATLERGKRADFIYSGAERVGVYTAAWAGGQRRFAVNLFDPDEGNIEPRTDVRIGRESVETTAPARPQELWMWALGGLLVLLIVEWLVYNLRVFI